MLSRLGRAAIATLLLAVALTSCRGSNPSSVRFGYRWDNQGNVVIAYPICPANKVSGSSITVLLEHGEKGSFRTLWSARNSTSKDVERGVFSVGTSTSFQIEEVPLRKTLPTGFYVGVEEVSRNDGNASSRDDWIDQSIRPSSPLKPGEYMTANGKIVSRKWVNDQLKCRS